MISKTEFKDQFFNTTPNDFTEPVEFINDDFGFSTTKKYPNGYASQFKIHISKEELSTKNPVKEIVASVAYGKQTGDGIVLSSSSEKIKDLFDPLDLRSSGDFFYNSKTNEFFYKEKQIQANEILEMLNEWHSRIEQPIKGLWLRVKILWFHYLLANFWNAVFKITAGIQYLATGEKIQIYHDLIKDPNDSFYLSEHPLDIKKSKLIDLWGYKVKPWIAGTYAAIHLSIFAVFFIIDFRPLSIKLIFQNNFLTLMYGVLSLGLANSLLPILFKPIQLRNVLKLIQSSYFKTAYRKIKIQ